MRIDYPRRGRDGWRRFIPSWRQWLGIFALGGAALVAAFIALYLLIDVPEPNDLATAQTSVVYYDDGKDIIGRYAEVNREIVALDVAPEAPAPANVTLSGGPMLNRTWLGSARLSEPASHCRPATMVATSNRPESAIHNVRSRRKSLAAGTTAALGGDAFEMSQSISSFRS